MNTWLCSRPALLLVALFGVLANPGVLVAADSAKWSRSLSTEYFHAESVQIASTSLGAQSSDGWFAHLAASSEDSKISQAASAYSWSASSGTRINARWNVAFGIDQWQGNGVVSQQTIIATVGYTAMSWLLDLSYRQRELRIEGQTKNGGTRKHFETFDGGELKFEYFFNELLSLGMGFTNYQSNPGAVFRALQERPGLVLQLGDHSFGLVSSQAENALKLTLNLQLEDWYFSVQAESADNYFSDVNSTVLTLYAEKNVNKYIAIGAEAGAQFSDDSDSNNFFSLAAHLLW